MVQSFGLSDAKHHLKINSGYSLTILHYADKYFRERLRK